MNQFNPGNDQVLHPRHHRLLAGLIHPPEVFTCRDKIGFLQPLENLLYRSL